MQLLLQLIQSHDCAASLVPRAQQSVDSMSPLLASKRQVQVGGLLSQHLQVSQPQQHQARLLHQDQLAADSRVVLLAPLLCW